MISEREFLVNRLMEDSKKQHMWSRAHRDSSPGKSDSAASSNGSSADEAAETFSTSAFGKLSPFSPKRGAQAANSSPMLSESPQRLLAAGGRKSPLAAQYAAAATLASFALLQHQQPTPSVS